MLLLLVEMVSGIELEVGVIEKKLDTGVDG